MNKIFVNNIGDLSEAQRASYYRFLSTGISEELLNFPNPFSAKIRVTTKKKSILSSLFIFKRFEIKRAKLQFRNLFKAKYDIFNPIIYSG